MVRLQDTNNNISEDEFTSFIEARDVNNERAWYVGDGSPTSKRLILSAGSSVNTGYDIDFLTSGISRLKVLGTGNVGIGTSSPTALLSVNGTANKPGGGSWATFSDKRLKDEASFKNFEKGLDAIMALKPISYTYKENNDLDISSGESHIGFIAQEVQKVIPEAVSEIEGTQERDDGALLEINNDPIMWTMLNAIKELFVKILGIEDDIQALQAENEMLRLEIETIKDMLQK